MCRIVNELARPCRPRTAPVNTQATDKSFAAGLTADQRRQLWTYLDDAVCGAYYAAERGGEVGLQMMNAGAIEDVALESFARQIAIARFEESRSPSKFAFGAGKFGAMTAMQQMKNLGRPLNFEPVAPHDRTHDEEAEANKVARLGNLRRALAAVGDRVPTDHQGWVDLGLSLGLTRRAVYSASKTGLVELVVQTLRERLLQVENDSHQQEVQPPTRIRERVSPTLPRKSSAQLRAESFVVAWTESGSAHGAAVRLGWTLAKTTGYARRLRRLGVTNLRRLPLKPGPVVRGVIALAPSAN